MLQNHLINQLNLNLSRQAYTSQNIFCENKANNSTYRHQTQPKCSLIQSFLLQKSHYEIDHQLFLLRFGTGNHHSKCDKRMVSHALGTILAQKQFVPLQKYRKRPAAMRLLPSVKP